ncbi:MAG: hypothetical protein AB7U82_12960 [Blastocatellales bacterium]
MAKPELKFNKLKATYLMLALCAILAVGSYGWHVYSLFRDWRLNMPQPQIEKLTKDLRLYHAKTGRFPGTFVEINNLIWRTKPMPNYGVNGRQAWVKNYYYFYTNVDERTCAIWVLPVGPQRHYASSFFLVLSPEWLRSWKGNALDDETISGLPAIPSPDKLTETGMDETPVRVFTAREVRPIQ